MDRKKTLLGLGLLLLVIGIVAFGSSHILGAVLLVAAVVALIASVRPGAAQRT